MTGHLIGRAAGRRWLASLLGAGCVLVAAACGSADVPESVAPTTTATPTTLSPEDLEAQLDPTCVASAAVEVGSTVQAVTVGGVTRSYLQYVPASYEGVGMPVVVSLHRGTVTAAQDVADQGLEASAETHGFVLLSPQAAGEPSAWDAATGGTDVAFMEAMLDQAQTNFCLEAERVYAVGVGDGGGMAARTACDLSDRIASVGFLGVVADAEPCELLRPVPLAAIGGREPDLAPWVDRYQCDPDPVVAPIELAEIEGTSTAYDGCVEGAAIESFAPADPARAGDLLWSFFVAHPLPAV